MVVPAYCRTRAGRVYRVQRSSALVAADRVRYALRAVPVKQDGDAGHEVTAEFDTSQVRDKIAQRQSIPTPEETFESLWQQLRLDLDVQYGAASD
jgi:hypothetical protein